MRAAFAPAEAAGEAWLAAIVQGRKTVVPGRRMDKPELDLRGYNRSRAGVGIGMSAMSGVEALLQASDDRVDLIREMRAPVDERRFVSGVFTVAVGAEPVERADR